MKIIEIMNWLDAKCLTGQESLNSEVNTAFGCDLMSDVLAFINEKTLLLTGLTNPQVIRTAEMIDINAIVFVRGKKPNKAVVDLANKNNMILLCTNHTLYTACGILYMKGLKGIFNKEENESYGQ
ncbi:DRTGG domain-containing protein [Marinisporobacter balticus]|uniref:DRTGG domain-containing protein n=1 Tax=Marinisporobacter balticus TaxID=2018667 RepID=A0A4R2L2W5_9FIRM|nr:DRTGG domain-containing protein [Marinisporobacter balticus]TCO80002.1 DRTGG domain-containing protein [Marinisporobacter balticus]